MWSAHLALETQSCCTGSSLDEVTQVAKSQREIRDEEKYTVSLVKSPGQPPAFPDYRLQTGE